MNIISDVEPSPHGPTLDTVECPTCRTKHLSGVRFSPMPTLHISKFIFNRIDDPKHDAVIYTWLNRDATLRHIEGELSKTTTELREERRQSAAIREQLDSITEQRNLYRSLVRNLDPHYDDDEF